MSFGVKVLGRHKYCLYFLFIHIILFLTLGMSCIVNAILLQSNSLELIQIVFSMLGRFVASVSIKTCYLCTAELFPTQIRNTAIGVGSIFGGIGSILGT